jgi:large subunit ribosomal protein L7A
VLSELKTGSRVVGAKQAKRAIDDGRALRVFLARDADPRVTEPLEALCKGKNVPVETACTMSELGSACNIAVGSAVAALIK